MNPVREENKITIAETVAVKTYMTRHLSELQSERTRAATEEVDKGATAEIPARNVDVITDEIWETFKDIRTIENLLEQANIQNYVEWDGQKITVSEAISFAKQIRSQIDTLKSLGQRKKIDKVPNRPFGTTDSVPQIRVALYDPDKYREYAAKLERQVNALSRDIDHSNHTNYIVFDASKYIG
jgi:hypothetical protein